MYHYVYILQSEKDDFVSGFVERLKIKIHLEYQRFRKKQIVRRNELSHIKSAPKRVFHAKSQEHKENYG